MRHRYLSNIFFILVAVIFFNETVHAQFIYKINGETGFYKSSGYGINDAGNLLASVEGLAGYKFQQDNRSASIQMRMRPELYDAVDKLSSLKFKVSADYYQREEKFNWGINVARQLFKFTDENLSISYDQFLLNADLSGFFLNNTPVSLNFGYAFQKLSSNGKQQLDMLFADSQLFEDLNNYLRIGYGLYIERFSLQNEMINPDLKIKENKGWRYGPLVSINYLKSFLLNFEYRFLFHDSQFTRYPSIEQWIRLIGGKIIYKRWSVFLLVNYYFRNFRQIADTAGIDEILYTPTNFENRVYAKFGFDVNDKFEIYLKPGYFMENLFSDKYSFEGWDVLIGFEVGN